MVPRKSLSRYGAGEVYPEIDGQATLAGGALVDVKGKGVLLSVDRGGIPAGQWVSALTTDHRAGILSGDLRRLDW
jgi:hypothetical protein